MEMFYNGLNALKRIIVYASVNGILSDKSYNKAYEILLRITNNDYQYPAKRVGTRRKPTSSEKFDAITSLTT